MPSVNGVVETSLYVGDLQRSVRFYEGLFGFRALLSEERLCALHVTGRQVLLLFLRGGSVQPKEAPQGGVIPGHDGSGRMHLGLAIAADELEAWEGRLREFGVEVESRVRGPGEGMSVYFRDPDGHLVELLTPGIWAVY
jgi:catechol 2,3-dioxygenase-like lactoylglutathione lyase family enzyme